MMNDEIIVVSGLPRSGTSMVMKMLAAGGVDVVTDNIRKADDDNPRGYFEYEKVKTLYREAAWLVQSKGKCIKIISHLLYYLPKDFNYKIIFIRRNMKEILDSQKKMYERLQKRADDLEDSVLAAKFNSHLFKVERWIKQKENIRSLFVHYSKIIQDPLVQAEKMRDLIGKSLDVSMMASAVDPSLYRNRVN
jgi:hypothetical protein